MCCFIISFCLFVFQIVIDRRKSVNQYIMLVCVIIANGGYLAQACSQNLSEILLAVKLSYVGGCFLPMLFFQTICEICHVKISTALKNTLYIFQMLAYGAVCTVGITDLYYVNPEFYTENGVGHVMKTYGPLHILLPFTMYGYVIAAIITALYSLRKKRSVNKKSLMILLFFFLVATVSYAVQKLLKINVEITPIIYTGLVLASMIYVHQSNFYTVNENEDIVKKQLNKVGFITFNSNLRYMGCNDVAGKIFPEIVDFKLGCPVENASEEFKTNVTDVLKHYAHITHSESERKARSFQKDGRRYKCVVHPLLNFRKSCKGYTVEIRDETDHYRALELSENFNKKLADDVDKKTKQIRDIQQKTILGMAQMVESRDLSTGGHIRRTSEVVRIFSRKLLQSDMDFDPQFLELVIRSAPMHDLGKIGVDDAILRKQSRFTDEEYSKMKVHSEIGAEIVRKVLTDVEEKEFVEVASNVAHYHHEKVNGKGYPDGLTGDQIPVEARIMALADVFDALVSKRCYKEAFSFDKAFEIIKNDSGSHFDKKLTEVFLQCRSELEQFYSSDV
ncbi:MAG: HD domain-containing protein [Oscillospiraceae bacterium]|nr:HD domain-containing protein [Oscillospiraceae bacterium]